MGQHLKEINWQDLLFTDAIEDDRTNCYLKLDDYDWMDYHLRTRFKTKEQFVLDVDFNYYGSTESCMCVTQRKFVGPFKKYNVAGFRPIQYRYYFDSDIFAEEITRYLRAHIDSWMSNFAFNGEEYVLHFFNRVLKENNRVEVEHDENSFRDS